MRDITPFTSGPQNAVSKLNDIIRQLNSLSNFTGDGLVTVNRTLSGYAISLNLNMLKSRLAYNSSSGGGGEASLDYVEIIESLTYPDPTGETQEEQLGRAYYRVRRLLHDIPPFNEAMEYANGQEVIYDNLAWLCQISEGTTTEVPGTGDDWVQSDLQIYAALGFDQVGSPYEAVPARDLRDCLPWLVAGQIVPLISVDKLGDGQETKYLLYSFFYTGSPASSSLRWNQEEKRVMAVFK